MYVDTFDLKGEKIPVRDSETRKIVDQLGNIISGTVGNSGLPIYLEDGEFKPCDSTLNVDITGKAQSAVTATHANSADTADSATHADTADSATHADTADSATRADTADSATHADTADSATRADTADSATHADTADSATRADTADSATRADTADSATRANTANSATRADTADSATRADTADSATHADTADSATHADTADSANNANTANIATNAISATAATTAEKLNVSAGGNTRPVYFSGGKPVQCGSTLDIDISGNADSANNANTANIATNAISATAATTAEKLNVSAGGNTRPVYFSGGKPVQCGSTLDIDISGNADSADKVTLNSVLSPPFIRIPIDTSDGRIYMLTGSTILNVNISTVYGNGFIGDFRIPIPLDVRLPHGYYSVQVTCQANSRVVIPALHVATGLANIVGWVESSIIGSADVLFYVFIMGY